MFLGGQLGKTTCAVFRVGCEILGTELIFPAYQPINITNGPAKVASTTNVGHFDFFRSLVFAGSYLGVPIVAIDPNFGYCLHDSCFVDSGTDQGFEIMTIRGK